MRCLLLREGDVRAVSPTTGLAKKILRRAGRLLCRRSPFRQAFDRCLRGLPGPVEREIEPRFEPSSGFRRLGSNEEPALHRSLAREVEGAHPAFGEHRFGLLLLASNDEVVLVDADAHGAAYEKGDAAEHLLLASPFVPARASRTF